MLPTTPAKSPACRKSCSACQQTAPFLTYTAFLIMFAAGTYFEVRRVAQGLKLSDTQLKCHGVRWLWHTFSSADAVLLIKSHNLQSTA